MTITDATPGASIFYTTDGSVPTSTSKPYTGAITLRSATTVINAIATATGYSVSSVASPAYQLMDFGLSASQASLTVSPGNSGTSTISVLPMNGFNGLVALSTSGLPSGVTPSFDQPSTSGSCTLTLTVAPSTADGTFAITISGVAGTVTHSATVSLTVQTVMTQVNLGPVFNMSGIYTDGTAFGTGGLDGNGNAYSANLIGSTASWNNATFTFGPANRADAVANATIGLPPGSFSTLNILATGVNGRQPSQEFIVGYLDGTTDTFTTSLSDWHRPRNYPGESVVQTMNYRDLADGGTENGSYSVYGYSFNLNPAKVVNSIALPSNQNVAVLAMTLLP